MEMMIVLIIIGMFVTFSARKFVDRDSEVKSTVRKFSALAKKLRDRARIENKTYRLVFDMPDDKKKQQSFWVESTEKQALLLSAEIRKEMSEDLEQELKDKGESLRAEEDGKKRELPDPQGFAPDTSIIKNAPSELPRSLYFDSIELDGDPVEKLSVGRIYIYFFPQGFVQGSAIHLTNRDKLNWTIAIQGVTGRVSVYPEKISINELKE